MAASIQLPAAHPHTLYVAKGVSGWTCDACKRRSQDLQWTHFYRCVGCCFDICEECSKPLETKFHPHRCVVSDTKKFYPDGKWSCDKCSCDYRSEGYISWHCEEGCSFDLCFGCTQSYTSFTHFHPLEKANSKLFYPHAIGWSCDHCKATIKHDALEKPYHCTAMCAFDLCLKCLKETIIDDQLNVKPNPTTETATDGRGFQDSTETAAQVFISYNWNIQEKVLNLKSHLESMNIKCWMDTGNMVGGDDLKKEIDKGMRGAKIVISCVTKAYSESNACQQEVALADVLKKPILPVLFESVKWPPEGPMAMPFAPLVYVSFENGLTKENLEKVVKTIRSRTGMKG